jgi:glycosyltransferase involved in cell wall biosynthesis
MLAVEDDHELAILCNLLVREVQTQKEPRLRELFLARLDELNARPSLPPETACRLSAAFLRLGLLKKARHALDLGAGTDERTEHQRRELDELDELGSRGFTYDKRIADYTPIPKRLLYVLHSSLPHHSSGYATRTHGLLGGIAGQGWQASGVTRLGYPQDLGALAKIPIEPHSIVDGVAYHRLTRSGPLFNSLPKCGYLRDYADALCELAKRERPQILHAAADFHNGLACTAAARALGIKSIYEVRGLWEITRGSREPEWMESEYFAMSTALEAQAARDADAVVVITRALGDEMVRRGVPREKITLIPNGVDVGRFIPRPRDQALADRLGLRNKRVIGYVGSIVDYEGLDLLMHVGDGVVLESLKTLARELGIDRDVVFTGRVPHHDVEAHYSLIDIAPFPRKSLPVTEMVSPLKPLEAMAMNKIVVASNVAALAEMIEPGVNGLTFRKDDVGDLADVLERLLHGHDVPANPREWVETHRSWKQLAKNVVEIYERLTA